MPRLGADERRHGGVRPGDGPGARVGGLIAAQLGLEREVRLQRLLHRTRHQGRTGVVQVDARRTPWGVGAPLFHTCIHSEVLSCAVSAPPTSARQRRLRWRHQTA